MRTFKTEGIVIRRINFGEADRILTVFTKKNGKIPVKALGVRRISSKRSPHTELLNFSNLTIHMGKGMPVLIEAQTVDDYSSVKENLTKVGFAYHLCELIDGLCAEGQEHPLIFDLFKQTLEKLSQDNDIVPIIHDFEVDLLTKLGFYSKIEASENLNTTAFIEQLLERKLKSKKLLLKL